MGIFKPINIDGGFDVLTLDTIFNFSQLALLENEEEELGGHTVEGVTSLARRVTHWLFVDLIGWSARWAVMRRAFSNHPIGVRLFRM